MHNKNKFYFFSSLILQYIFSLSEKSHFFVVCLVNQVVATECKKKKNHESAPQLGLSQSNSLSVCQFTKMAAVCFLRIKSDNKTLQRALGAATFQRGLHLFGVRGAVGAAENHLPSSALGDSTANTCGCCCLAGSETVHAGNLTGRCACSQWLVSLQLLPDHLSLTRELWTWN